MNNCERIEEIPPTTSMSWLFGIILRYRIWVIIVSLLIAFGIGSGMEKLEFSSDYRDFFKEDNPKLQAFEALQDKFVRSHNVFLAIEAKDQDIFSPVGLKRLSELTNELWTLPFVMRVDSLTNHQFVEAEMDEIMVWEYRTRPAGTDQLATQFHRTALKEKSLNGFLVTNDPSIAGINLSLSDDATTEQGKVEFMAALEMLLKRGDFENFNFYKSGSIVIDHGFDVAAQADLETLYGIFYLMVLALVFLLTRSLSAVFGVLLTVTMSWLIALGAAAFLGIKLTAISVTTPTVLMTLAVAQSMHVIYSIQKGRSQDIPIIQAVQEALCYNVRPLFLVSLSTTLGFIAVMFSDVPPLQDLGFILAVGTLAVFGLSITFLPAFLSFFSLQAKRYISWTERTSASIGGWVGQHSQELLLIGSFLAIILVIPIGQNEINDNFIEYFDKQNTIRKDSMFINDKLTGVHQIFFEVEANQKFGIFEPSYLSYIESLSSWLREQPEVRYVSSVSDIIKRLHKAAMGDEEQAYDIPDSKDLASQLFLLYEMSLPLNLSPRNLVDINQKSSRITVVLNNISSKKMLDLESRVKQWNNDQESSAMLHAATGPTIMFAAIGQSNSKNVVVTTAIALAFISLILLMALRRIKFALISLIPNLLPAAMAFGIWGLIDGEVGLATSVVILMTFGIVVDDTIYFLTRYKENLNCTYFDETISQTYRQVGVPLFNTSLILTIGFAILAFSNFRLSQGMGILTSLVIFLALLCDLFILPGLIKRFIFQSRKETI